MAVLLSVSRKAIGLRQLGHRHGLVRGLSTFLLPEFSLPDLPYDYSALEPVITAEIVKLQQQQRHQSYVTNYNKALVVVRLEHALTMADSPTIVRLQSAIKFNGGGSAIDTQYGSLEALIRKVNAEGAALQGSGRVWLALDNEQKKVSVETTANQDPLVPKGSALVLLIGIDVWEHAHYLQEDLQRPGAPGQGERPAGAPVAACS